MSQQTPRKLSESQIQETCCAYLELDGWRRVRTDLKKLRGMGVQEKGMADDLFIRYRWRAQWNRAAEEGPEVIAEVFWVEWKAKKGVHGDKQRDWQLLERSRGALVAVSKIDFEPSIEGFQDWYRNSGLMRRKLLTAAHRQQKRNNPREVEIFGGNCEGRVST